VIEQLSLNEVSGRRVSTYSGGQRRRLDLGASLVGAPRLLLLDEPTTGLDPTSRREVWDAIRNLVDAGTDVLLTTHYLEEADALADRVLVIDRGRVVGDGTLSQLKSNLGSEVIALTVTDPQRIDDAGRVLESVTSTPIRLDHARHRVSAATNHGTRALAATIRCLDDNTIAVQEIELRRPSLDEVFAVVTEQREQDQP
jgi:ABC-2 type transport system ATP-binding protein